MLWRSLHQLGEWGVRMVEIQPWELTKRLRTCVWEDNQNPHQAGSQRWGGTRQTIVHLQSEGWTNRNTWKWQDLSLSWLLWFPQACSWAFGHPRTQREPVLPIREESLRPWILQLLEWGLQVPWGLGCWREAALLPLMAIYSWGKGKSQRGVIDNLDSLCFWYSC